MAGRRGRTPVVIMLRYESEIPASSANLELDTPARIRRSENVASAGDAVVVSSKGSTPRASASAASRGGDGTRRPFSYAIRLGRAAPIRAPRESWESPLALRASSRRCGSKLLTLSDIVRPTVCDRAHTVGDIERLKRRQSPSSDQMATAVSPPMP